MQALWLSFQYRKSKYIRNKAINFNIFRKNEIAVLGVASVAGCNLRRVQGGLPQQPHQQLGCFGKEGR